MDSVEDAYRDACASGTLPGVVLLAADKEGMPHPQFARLVNEPLHFRRLFRI